MRLLSCLLCVLFVAASSPAKQQYLVSWAMESRSHRAVADGTGHDFLAVFDISDTSDFGHLVAMLPVPARAQMAHHTNYTMPPNYMLFANDFMADQSYVFDLRNPTKPRVAASFTDAGPYSHPHSFAYLSNGNVLATYQIKGTKTQLPGALVELDEKGHMLRTSDASAPSVDPNIRPYSLLVLERLNRVVTTSGVMPPLTTSASSDVVQVWRLSDLKLLKTVVLPKPRAFDGAAAYVADEARLLSDGKTVLVKTASCGLYRLNGLAGTNPSAQLVYDFGYRMCAGVPIVIGPYWIEPSMSGHSITALNVRDPSHPVESGHVIVGSDAYPHWMAADPGTTSFVITGYGSMLNKIEFGSIDMRTGALTLAARTIDFNRKWPDGWDGPAIPHATLFY